MKTVNLSSSNGKKLNFICQEIGREINTIGSKCGEFNIQKAVINMKNNLEKIKTEILLAYGVYQVEAEGLDLFEYIKGDRDSIMGLPIKQIMNYIKKYNK